MDMYEVEPRGAHGARARIVRGADNRASTASARGNGQLPSLLLSEVAF